MLTRQTAAPGHAELARPPGTVGGRNFVFLPGRLLPFAGSGRPGFIPAGYRVTGIPVRPGSISSSWLPARLATSTRPAATRFLAARSLSQELSRSLPIRSSACACRSPVASLFPDRCFSRLCWNRPSKIA